MNIIMLIPVIIIFLKAPVDNVNKPLDKKEHGIYRKRCGLILIIQCFIYLIFKSINLMVSKTICINLLVIMIALL